MDIKRKSPFALAGIPVGPGCPVRLMGVINMSPESFYQGSVPASDRLLARAAEAMERDGADFIDVGAMSTAPYLKTEISEREEARRLQKAVRIIRKASSLPISIDTSRSGPAEAGLAAGADILNDVTGLTRDKNLGKLAACAKGVILMAHPSAMKKKHAGSPISLVTAILQSALHKAHGAGVLSSRLVLDPGIGFFRHQKKLWWKWDLAVLRDLKKLNKLKNPILIGVSRKSFIGHILGGLPADERLSGSLSATILAVKNGASLVRTHDIKPTRQALLLAESITLKSA